MEIKKRNSITTKIIIGFIIASLLIGSVIFIILKNYGLGLVKYYYKSRSIGCARTVSSLLYDVDLQKYLQKGKDEHYEFQHNLMASISKNFKLKYLYVYFPDFENNEVTAIFSVDGRTGKDVENWSLGVKHKWLITQQEKDAYNGEYNPDMVVTHNRYGNTVTSYAPVYNSNNEVVALIGIDYDFDYIQKNVRMDSIRIVSFLTAFLLLLCIVLISYLKIVVLKPVVDISKRMSTFTEKSSNNFVPVSVSRNDELGVMENSFNKMVFDINSYVKRILETQMETIFSLSKLAQSRDEDTGTHLERVQQYCEILARKLSETEKYKNIINEEYIRNLVNASTLHDIGKVGIADHVLLHNGKLSEDMFEIIKKHTSIGYETLKEVYSKYGNNPFIEMGMYIALYHHERWDGTGYPKGLKGIEIPLEARIMSIADVYDALSEKRVYKPAFEHEKCVQIITDGRGTQFDPDLIDAFLAVENKFKEIRDSYRE